VAPEIDRREISLRWLGASVLTGVAGAALIGASIYIALEGITTVAEPPERAVAGAPRGSARDDRAAPSRKGDKLVRAEMVASAKQSFKTPVSIRNGDRDVIRVRQFVRLATNLALSTGVYATDIPTFNPMRLFAENAGERYVEPVPEATDTDVAVTKRDLTELAVPESAPGLSDEDVAALLEEERRLASQAGRSPGVPIAPQLMLSRTLRQPSGLEPDLGPSRPAETPFHGIEVRVVPENVTVHAMPPRRDNEPPLIQDRDLILQRGETLETALTGLGAAPDQIRSISTALGTRVKVAALPEGQRIRVLIAPGPGPGNPRQVVRVILFGERGVEAIAAVNDRGMFVSVAPPNDEGARKPAGAQQVAEDKQEEEEEDPGAVRLYESLYETVLKNELPRQTVEELVRIFGYDVDFQRKVTTGDSFELFYAQDEDNGTPEILYATLTLGGEARRVYRFQGEDGVIDFFDEAGRSLKKFLIRKPIADGILRSGFGFRRHRILRYSKMHTGVDWANRIGTPIVAAGNGTVLKAEWDSGYGRRIEIQHTNGYVTAYSHQSRFASGIKAGARVRQGQVIGYVGSTGLSTGPHLHYEVMINGRFVDPLKIRLPRGRELDGRAMAEFKRQQEQVNALLEQTIQASLLQRQARLR
jgi:murein DD-endopeptidase MepM/ murein hydrolase activator NlpD